MKLVFFNDFTLGVVKGDSVVDVSGVVNDIPHISPQDLLAGLITRWDEYKGKLQSAVDSGSGVPTSSVKMRSPVPKPHNIDCMAVNYMESGTRDEPAPKNGFLKSANCVIGDGETIVLPDMGASIFEHEAELGLVISKRASNVKAADAYDYIFGYMNFIDVSARGVPAFYQMKSRETFAPMGPWLVTADEVPDPQKLGIKLWVNGNLMQEFNTDDMAHKIPQVIEFITAIHTLETGDVIATGTNHRGLSALMDGDKMELEVEGMGRLHNDVRDDLKRTWSRETRLDRMNKGEEGTTPQLTGKYS